MKIELNTHKSTILGDGRQCDEENRLASQLGKRR